MSTLQHSKVLRTKPAVKDLTFKYSSRSPPGLRLNVICVHMQALPPPPPSSSSQPAEALARESSLRIVRESSSRPVAPTPPQLAPQIPQLRSMAVPVQATCSQEAGNAAMQEATNDPESVGDEASGCEGEDDVDGSDGDEPPAPLGESSCE